MKLILKDANIHKLHGKIDQKKRTKIYAEFKSQVHEDMAAH